ncbi:phosphoribosylformylglycinamidine synthase subunit PurL [Tepidanaerobacter syntrophicus]|uniref:Phosphoribosylformylglycinamidine synthase subunit PurL n=2 Tax=Tepidanaerobacter syntrophicus TaxID=224999 RepID=A0A0U9I2U8_9FIRM|nr:phosphoribosylformylglycinamidine synthase subunit PurL [Tepidanaerobacter syntrophicus]GAQ24184.1 phosphoribosylformylglycinamidine synthase [Tepidanaerobacter syntrophicus]
MTAREEAKNLGLTDLEFDEIVKTLKREPNYLELSLYSVMWSEHCSYKNSKAVLKRFPTEGPQVLQGPGENAGIVDIGDNLAIAMKTESHNHPSAVDPYQGAATGAGGMLRDIFTMGARPIALLNSLRFGKLDDDRAEYLFREAVAGIGDYGNAIGVPTVGGEVYFDDSYEENPLVNAMCLGIVPHDKIVLGKAAGVGNSVMIVGAATGRDGMHGASFASGELTEGNEDQGSPMQVGDPFKEKQLMEACMELLQKEWVVGVQDMGAAGVVSSTSETAARAGNGIEIDVALVPQRDKDMKPYEIMISESQERMLVIVEKGHEDDVKKIFEKWDLDAVKFGTVTDDGMLRILENGKVVGEVPAASLAGGVPIVKRESRRPEYLDKLQTDFSKIPVPSDLNDILLKLLDLPNIASKAIVYRQFDQTVGTNTVVTPGSDAAVLRIKGTKRGIAVTIDGNGYYCYLDPYEGGKQIVAEAARNLVVSGAKPVALTDGLNFGNPEKPEVYYQFEKCVDGLSDAARKLGVPVISGNVSFYNEGKHTAIYPSPVVGMLGVLEDVEKHCTMDFKQDGDVVVLLGENTDELGGSIYLQELLDIVAGPAPKVDIEKEKKVQDCCLKAIQLGLVNSAHDIVQGGLAIALAECCIAGNIGFEGEIESNLRPDTLLFGEGQSRIIMSLKQDNLSTLNKLASELGVKVSVIGFVKGDSLKLTINQKDKTVGNIEVPVKKMAEVSKNAIKGRMKK